MTEPTTIVISVRGDARQVVPPDVAVLRGQLRAVAPAKDAALREAAAAQAALVEDLVGLGAEPLRPESERRPLTWSVQSATTQPEYDFDEQTGRQVRTGNVLAEVAVLIQARDLQRLADLAVTLARHETLHLFSTSWSVDEDNASWPAVRAAAINAAIARGRDYAAAVGGTLLRLEHIADVGLLGDTGPAPTPGPTAFASRALAAEAPEAPSLDPVPQTLQAVVEARFLASAPALS